MADIEEHELDVESLNRLVNEIAAALPDDPDQVEKALTDVATINNTYKKLKAAAIAKRDVRFTRIMSAYRALVMNGIC